MKFFSDTETAFRYKSTRELRKALWLFRIVGNPFMVKLGSALLRFALRIGFPVRWALKPTVFAHFCGGETINECDRTIGRLGDYNVLTILDYSAEGKEGEADFEHTKEQIISTIDKAAGEKNIPYAVFKPTGLSRFGLLEKVQTGVTLNDAEKEELERVKKRFWEICGYGYNKGVPVMIDSEESWIQTVVDGIVEDLMFFYNKEKPMIFNTLQMYRHDRLEYLEKFIEKTGEKGVFPAFKLVRGAYMEKERERADKLGYDSPIYPDKDATDKAFDRATEILLGRYDRAAVCVGTHNENSCAAAAGIMKEIGVKPDHPNVSFAQLLGMSDHISFSMAADGYNVCKYVPYGPVNSVVPYLIRRAEENTSVAGQTSRELYLLKREIARRRNS